MEGFITLSDFEKLDIKVAEIINVSDIEGADKLYKIEADVGGKQITIVAGIKMYYKKEELLGKRIVVVTNMQPIKIRGITSEGMLLAAIEKDTDKIALLIPDRDIEVGSNVA